MYFSRMLTARMLPYGGFPDREPLDRDPHLQRFPPVMLPVVHAGTENPWTETPVNRITDMCKNITLPQQS